jgi:hypothetical protein
MKKRSDLDWDQDKDLINQEKHGVSFALAQLAFLDHNRVILAQISHQPRLPCMRGPKQGAIVVLCTLLRQRCRRGEIGWPSVNIVYDFQMKGKYV